MSDSPWSKPHRYPEANQIHVHEQMTIDADAITLTGDTARAYRALEQKAKAAMVAQQAHSEAGAELRSAIEALCRVMAPGTRP